MSTTDLAALDLVDSVELAGEEMSEQSLYGAVEMSDVTGIRVELLDQSKTMAMILAVVFVSVMLARRIEASSEPSFRGRR